MSNKEIIFWLFYGRANPLVWRVGPLYELKDNHREYVSHYVNQNYRLTPMSEDRKLIQY